MHVRAVGVVCILCAGLLSLQTPAAEIEDQSGLVRTLTQPWLGDLDGMVRDRVIRALVAYDKTHYFLDRGDQYGFSYELLKQFEKFVNDNANSGGIPVKVAFLPVTPDRLLPSLVEGIGDIAAANLTVTPERFEKVAFSDPLLEGVRELLVTGPAAPTVHSVEDLAGQKVYVRASSSYFESLQMLNGVFKGKGLAPVQIVEADENLKDSDLLEMVNVGVIGMTVVDSHKANFWKEVFDEIVVHDDIALRDGASIAWAFRKDSPKLAATVNAFIKTSRKGTLLGNIFYKRYLLKNKWVRNPVSQEEIEKLDRLISLFQKYGEAYAFDWQFLGALAYQESGLDQSKRSAAGAVGIMQVLPTTAADPKVDIPQIDLVENNIHAGARYLRYMVNEHFSEGDIDELNQVLFALASYNAGPGRVSGLRREAAETGLDPNVWFDNVEVVAAKRIGAETVNYVSNIYKYYVVYELYDGLLTAREQLGIDS